MIPVPLIISSIMPFIASEAVFRWVLCLAGQIKSPAEAGLPQCVLRSAEHTGRVNHTSGRKQPEGDQC